MHILDIKHLSTYFNTYAGLAKAVDDVSFHVKKNEMVGVVGESGCGKSVMARSILRLVKAPGRIVDGEIFFAGKDLLKLTEKQMRMIRGNDISMIFQEPMSSLNPAYNIGKQVSEIIMLHQAANQKEATDKTIALLRMVGIPSPESRIREYPFQMSGGMRQRVIIAMALACKPKIILADEPTTALDVTIQAQVLELIQQLQSLDTSVVLITHDLGVIAQMVQRILVMYTGKIVEQANVEDLFNNPLHPYTYGLMESIPSLDSDETRYNKKLKEIKGIVPDLRRLPSGCSFYPRCDRVMDICKQEPPELFEVKECHKVRCWLYK